MKQTIRLTEGELKGLIRNVINEQLQMENEMLNENKLIDFVKRYGAAAVLAAAIAGGLGGGGNARPNFHIYGENMPAGQSAIVGNYDINQDGKHTFDEPTAFCGTAVGNNNQAVRNNVGHNN